MKAVAWIAAIGLASASGQVITFDSGTIGRLPEGWVAGITNHGSASHWEIRRDQTAPTQPNVLAQVSRDPTVDRFPLAILDNSSLRDGDISVRMKPVGGREDQGGGVVWRYHDNNNYYLVRANALEKNVAVYKVVKGVRIPLTPRGMPANTYGIKHDIISNTWSILKVSARGPHFAIYVNHRRILQVDDSTFSAAGKVGLWTKSDSVTYFDDFRVYPK